MLFNTVQYLVFLTIVVLVYYILPSFIRYLWLLAASYYFYMQWNPAYILLLFFCTCITFAGGLAIEKQKKDIRKQKIYLGVCILCSLGILGFYKYFYFLLSWINVLFAHLHIRQVTAGFDILLPVGISFYTLQSLGYLIDVYRGTIYAEKNFFRYALFISFFPQLVAGPIERSKNLLVQLHGCIRFQFENLKKGILLITYGLFLKMVVADRAAIVVDTVFEHPSDYPGFYIASAACFFAFQIYCDFYGYTTIARGSALLMGFSLLDNFSAPYFAKSVKEFWRRWHISLSGWFRDYLYIPCGGSKKGFIRKEANLLFVFAVSGLWHGASMGFVFWGMLHAWYQIAADLRKKSIQALETLVQRIGLPVFFKGGGQDGKCKEQTFGMRLLTQAGTFLLVCFAWMFFRAGGLTASLHMLQAMVSVNNWTILLDGSLYNLGVPRNYMYVMLIAILVLIVVDYYKYQGRDPAALVLKQGFLFQIFVVLAMLFAILLYGCYGTLYDTHQFIYFQF